MSADLFKAGSLAAAGALVGAALIRLPVFAVGALVAVGAACLVTVLVCFRRELPRAFLGCLGIVLLGYAFLAKSFAYLGVPPVFIGEVVLAFGVVAALASGSLLLVMRSSVTWLILVWSLWGAVRTAPYLGVYGPEALRDAALWGYSAFALAVAACVLSTQSVRSVTRHYGGWVTRFVAWLPVALILARFLGALMPTMPGTDVPLFTMKASDGGVHLAGAAVFVLGGLSTSPREDTRGLLRVPYAFWALWLLGLACVVSLNRGGFVGAAAALLLASTLEPVLIGRRVAAATAVAVLVAAVLVAASANFENTSQSADASNERAMSPRQGAANVLSIVGLDPDNGSLTDTKEWRLDWWNTIVRYTIFGPYFWSGKGFGLNLADDDGFQVISDGDAPLRSPHSGHMTVLARMGVPGAVLWGLLQLCFGSSLLRAYLRARNAGAQWWARVDLWMLSYWFAFLVVASFDVFLEGPMAGIWFWCVIGFGIALVEVQREEVAGARVRRISTRRS